MNVSSLILAIVIVSILVSFRIQKDRRKIEEKVDGMGCEIVLIEWKAFDKGPFRFVMRGTMIYRFEYIMKGEGLKSKKEAWVRFGGWLLGTDWKF